MDQQEGNLRGRPDCLPTGENCPDMMPRSQHQVYKALRVYCCIPVNSAQASFGFVFHDAIAHSRAIQAHTSTGMADVLWAEYQRPSALTAIP